MADVYYAVVPVVVPSSATTFTATSASLGGKTPKVVILFGGSAPNGNGATPSVDFQHAIGWAINGASHCVSSFSQDGQTATSNNRRQNGAPISTVTSPARNFTVSSFAADTVTFSVTGTDGGSLARDMWALLIAGDDVQVAEGRQNLGTGTSALTQTPGFAADLVFTIGAVRGNTDSTSSSTTAAISYGIVHNDRFVSPNVVKQRSVMATEAFSVFSGGQPCLYMSDAYCGGALNTGSAALIYGVTAGNFTATSFDLTPSASASSDRLAWLAIYLGGKRAYLTDFTIPTGTGSQAYTGVGFEPAAVLLCGTSLTSKNAGAFNNATAAGFSTCGFDPNNAWSHSAQIDFNADPTDCNQVTNTKALYIPTQMTPLGVVADFVSMDNDGYTLDYTTVTGNALEVFSLALEGNALPVTGDARLTDMPLLVGSIIRPPSRITQAPAIVGVLTPAWQRVTQAAVLVGVKADKPPCLTQDADLWRIERTDGTVYRFTSHDRRLTFRGEVYTPCGSLTASALQLSAELGSTDNLDLSGIIYEGGISEADLWSDAFAGAEVEVWRVPWQGSGTPVLLAAGTVGSRTFGDTEYKFEIVTAGEKLSQRPILSPVMPTCRYQLGDSRCTVNLPALAVTGTVTGVAATNYFTAARRRIFTDTGRTEPDGKFTLGQLTWTGGGNNGLSVKVKSYANDMFVLDQPMPVAISVGDTYSVTPGCDRTPGVCHGTFANKINFGGFEHVRGYDDLNATPDQDI